MSTAIVTTSAGNAGSYSMVALDTSDQRLAEMWIDKPRKSKTGKTAGQYAAFWLHFSEALPVPLQQVTYGHLHAWYKELEQQVQAGELAESTLRNRVSYMKSLFSFATRLGYLKANPALLIESPAVGDATHERILSEAEVLRMLDAPGNERDRVLLRVLYSSALRISELLALTWQDVLPLESGGALLAVKAGKGGKSRKADISPATYAELLSLRNGAAATEPIFKSNRGNALERSVVNKLVRKAAEQAGIDRPVSPHWFRHSSLSHAANRGANLRALQAKSGHSSLDMLSKYLHSNERTSELLVV